MTRFIFLIFLWFPYTAIIFLVLPKNKVSANPDEVYAKKNLVYMTTSEVGMTEKKYFFPAKMQEVVLGQILFNHFLLGKKESPSLRKLVKIKVDLQSSHPP